MATAEGLRRAVKGLSEADFRERFGTEEACRQALFAMRWRVGLACPGCGGSSFCRLRTRELLQCNRCKRQVRFTAGTVFQDTKLPLTAWFAAAYHLTQSKGGISSIELGRRLGVRRQWTDPLSLDGVADRDQAASRALISSKRAGLRYPSAECSRLALYTSSMKRGRRATTSWKVS